MINRRTVHEAYEQIEPSEQQKNRMLAAIRSQSQPSASARKPLRIIWLVAALLTLLTATAVSAAEPFKQWIQVNETISDEHEPVTVNISIDEEITGEILPLIEVQPNFFTGEDVHRVAEVLFPGAEFYEFDPDPVYSKEQFQTKVNRWSEYTRADAVEELIGYDPRKPDWTEEIAQMVQKYVDIYTQKYDSAPLEDQRKPCHWEFQSEMYYMYTQEEIIKENPEQYGVFNQGIQSTFVYDGIPYIFTASVRDLEDFKVNNIAAYPYDGFSPKGIDEYIFHRQLCRAEKPSEEQVNAVKQKAQNILAQMGMGSWLIDECYVNERVVAGVTEYEIQVNAVPVFQGIPAVRCPQLSALRDWETGESYYYYTDVNFRFAPNGELLLFRLYSPVTITNSAPAGTGQMSVEDLLEIAKSHLVTDVYERYSTIPHAIAGEDNVYCVIDVMELEYSLTRVKGDGDYIYLYTPGMTLTGDIRYYEKGTDKLIHELTGQTLLIMNGLDGTIVDRIN